MAAVTLSTYRRVLNGVWRPAIGQSLFHQVTYSKLVEIVDTRPWSKKTYNNAISILRRAFDFGYCNHPEQHNPARSLRGARLRKADRPRIDPFCKMPKRSSLRSIVTGERRRETTTSSVSSQGCGLRKRSRSCSPISTW
jgi:hypothetical protein